MSRLPAKLPAAQACMDLATDEDRRRADEEVEREKARQHVLFAELMGTLRAATIAMGGTKVVAGRLDDLWGGGDGKGTVGESRYRAALEGANYNVPRVEWLIELALDPRVAEVLRRIADGKAEIEPEEERDNVYDILETEFLHPKQVAAIRRRARAMRRKAVR